MQNARNTAKKTTKRISIQRIYRVASMWPEQIGAVSQALNQQPNRYSVMNRSHVLLIVSILLVSCFSNQNNDNQEHENKVHRTQTWLNQDVNGFSIIEIFADSTAKVQLAIDRHEHNEPYYFYSGEGKIGLYENANVDFWIKTPEFRFDFRLSGDTLFEISKMGVNRVYELGSDD